jgi:hypothetical protein
MANNETQTGISESEFYLIPDTLDDVMSRIREACENGLVVHGSLLVSAVPFDTIVGMLRSPGAGLWGLELRGNDPYVLSTNSATNTFLTRDAEVPTAFMFRDGAAGRVLHLISGQERDSLDHLSSKLHSFLTPYLVRVHLKTRNVYDCLKRVAIAREDLHLRIREYVAKSLINDPNSCKRVDTVRRWTDSDFTEVFDSLSSQKQWLSSYKLDVRGATPTSGRMWRDSSYSCDKNYKTFRGTMVDSYLTEIVREQRVYESRDRETSPSGIPRPLRIVFDRPVFSDKSENRRLVEALERMSECSVSVLHPNPYLHVSLLDYLDGSFLDVWVTSPDAVLVVPQQKSTSQSLLRVCEQVCDRFEEGVVKEQIVYE